MAWAAAIPAVAGAFSSIAPMLFNNKKGKKFRYRGMFSNNPIEDKVIMAKRAGIHPLVALGADLGNTGGFAQTPVGWGDALGGAVDALGSGIGQYMEQDADREDRERMESERRSRDALDRAERLATNRRLQFENERDRLDQKRIDDAQLELIKAQTESIKAQARATAIGGAPRTESILDFNKWPKAQEVQNEYDDWVSGPYGVYRFIRNHWFGADGEPGGESIAAPPPSNLKFFQ